jgi:putative DNA primase/helicase
MSEHVAPHETADFPLVDAVQFANERSKVPIAWHGRLDDLIGRTHRIARDKLNSPGFSPVEYVEGAFRSKAGVRHVTALVLDFDHLGASATQAMFRCLDRAGWTWIAYTSFSHRAHGADDQCFRVVIAVTRPILPDEYPRVWDAVNGVLGAAADPRARDVSRLWFLPACPSERADVAWIRCNPARPLDVDRALLQVAPTPARKPRSKQPEARSIEAGQRNAALTSLAGSLRRRSADEATILAALTAANAAQCTPPLADAEVERIAASVVRYDPTSVLLLANRTDLGNAERFEWANHHTFRYVHAWSTWIRYDGARWVRDESGHAIRAVRDLLRELAAAAASVPGDGEPEALLAFALRSENHARITATLALAAALLPVAAEEMDRDADLLSCANGTIDLRTGTLRAHDRADLIMRKTEVLFDPDAECPTWDAFLRTALKGSQDLIDFVQRAVGYSLTAHTTEQVLFLLHGQGANGKSTFLETLRAVLGDYGKQTDFDTFRKKDASGPRNDLARLVGVRFVAAVEAEAGMPLAEALVKQLTGGDTITARFLHHEFFEFKPALKLWLAANHRPRIGGTDIAIWRRIHLIPFTAAIATAERDRRLPEKLRAELPGILAWAVRGCLAWRQAGLGTAPEVTRATAEYRGEMDVIGTFLAEETEPGGEDPFANLYDAFKRWCKATGESLRSEKAFTNALRAAGHAPRKGAHGARLWSGLHVKQQVPGGRDEEAP